MNNIQIEQVLKSYNFTEYKWLNPQKDITLAHWVRFKCMYGCHNYGKSASCPPAVPPVDECHKMIREYKSALIIHFSIQSQTKEEKQQILTDLMSLEREIFLAGYYKVLLLPHSPCRSCENCVAEGDHINCIDKGKLRPGPDAMGIDIFQTALDAGFRIKVITDRDTVSDRFSFILIE